jgi:hypothetical protein
VVVAEGGKREKKNVSRLSSLASSPSFVFYKLSVWKETRSFSFFSYGSELKKNWALEKSKSERPRASHFVFF